MDDFDRTPPQDAAAEQSILGAILLAPGVLDEVITVLDGRDFYQPRHETIYAAALALRNRREPVDAVSVAAHLQVSGDLAKVGGPAYLHTLLSSTPTAANAGYYAKIVRERAVLRRLVAAGTRVVQLGYATDGGDVDATVAAAVGEVMAVGESARAGTDRSLWDIADAALEQIDAGITCVPTPWAELNYLIEGWVDETFVAIGARPGVGKTVIGRQISRSYAEAQVARDKRVAAYFTPEMSAERLYQRDLAGLAGVPLRDMRRGSLTEHQWHAVAAADRHLRDLPMVIVGASGMTARQIAARCRALHREAPLGMVTIDHIGLVVGEARGRGDANKQAELSDAADVFLALAHELGVTVVVVTQLNRGVTQRADQRPVPSDIRDTDRIEQNADLVLMLHRDIDDHPDELHVAVPKNRDGEPGAFTLTFHGDQAKATSPQWRPSDALGRSA
jgi:replicative DNA helicase